ncbi:hypothetical protein DFH27DRAFT_574295 [Peziza echinospora]|nr:hypothetical protein DFH27DRAFT_574295 [Peziza echinospora]
MDFSPQSVDSHSDSKMATCMRFGGRKWNISKNLNCTGRPSPQTDAMFHARFSNPSRPCHPNRCRWMEMPHPILLGHTPTDFFIVGFGLPIVLSAFYVVASEMGAFHLYRYLSLPTNRLVRLQSGGWKKFNYACHLSSASSARHCYQGLYQVHRTSLCLSVNYWLQERTVAWPHLSMSEKQ